MEDADISERSNTSAAFTFLREIEDRKCQEDEGCGSNSESSKIVFNRNRENFKFKHSKHIKKQLEKIEDDDVADSVCKPAFKQSKLVMPEYDFGASKKQKKTQLNRTQTSEVKAKNTLQLDHLLADEEEEEEYD